MQDWNKQVILKTGKLQYVKSIIKGANKKNNPKKKYILWKRNMKARAHSSNVYFLTNFVFSKSLQLQF